MTPTQTAGRLPAPQRKDRRLRRKWLKRLGIGLLALVVLGAIIAVIVLSRMFPSKDTLNWPELPPSEHVYAYQSRQLVTRFIDVFDQLEFGADPTAALTDARQYRYLRDSPYLPADRAAAQRVFSVAAGKVLLDEDLSRVAHANAVYEGRYALYVPGGDSVSLTRDIPPGAVLSLGILVLPPFQGVQTCPVEVTISTDVGGDRETLKIDRRDGQPFEWSDLDVPLLRTGMMTLQITVETTGACTANGHAFLSDPSIFAPANDPPINVLYVNVCTWRADDLGPLGEGRGATPAMSALASRGHLFTEARSNANWSKASQISALTGRYASSLGLKHFRVPVSDFERSSYTHAQWPTLASVLRKSGYETAAFVDNIFLADYLRVGVDLGFARFIDNARHIHNTVDIVGNAVDWLSAHGDRPFFLYLNPANPHHKYRPPREYLSQIGFGWSDVMGEMQHALHLGEVAFTDDAVGRLLQTVENLGLTERTLVILHGDHGETLEWARDLQVRVPSAHKPRASMVYPTTRYKHGWSWQETEVRVPMLYARPGAIEPATDPRPASPIDVAPTVLAHLGIDVPPTMHGRDAFDKGPTVPILIEGKGFDAVVDGAMKFVRFWPGFGWWRHKASGETHESAYLLFDLETDPEETQNLTAERQLQRLGSSLDRVTPSTAPLHILQLAGPKDAVVSGQITFPDGLLSATVRGQSPSDRFGVGPARVDFSMRMDEAPVYLAFIGNTDATPSLQVDAPTQLLAGPHALPILGQTADAQFDPRWLAIGADQTPDAPADTPRVLWWTQRLNAGGPEPWRLRSLEADVMDAMRDWGYAQ